MFRYENKNNYYRFSIDNQNGYKRLIKKSKGIVSVLAKDGKTLNSNEWETIKIQINNGIISVFINDKYIFHAADNTLSTGKIGLYCWGNENAEFRDVNIASLDYEKPEIKAANTDVIIFATITKIAKFIFKYFIFIFQLTSYYIVS